MKPLSDRARMVLGTVCAALLLGGSLSACSHTPNTRNAPPRVELLTADELKTAEPAVREEYYIGSSTRCGPDENGKLPSALEKTPNVTYFEQDERRIIIGVWDEEDSRPSQTLEDIVNGITHDKCRLGKAYFTALGEKYSSSQWRVDPLNFGQDVVAFRAIEWAVRPENPVPPAPVKREGVEVYSTARAYGIVDGKLVMVRIDDTTVEPPSEAELRALWNAQAGKVLYLDGLEHAQELLTPQSEQTNK
ncbi:hypothetical protein [Schaalia canis]|uniref:Lipoprotein n=1 Tax=Schaalia canis TaxID=100469 RepID=A0A3P1SBS2_9ACTO|nr:hypothetical protein [Schaalia canis]RRC94504.1 hypothetical protein EII11_09800 [Schaalia canis]